METIGNENSDVRARTIVVQVETEQEITARPQQTVKTNCVLNSLSPLIMSMKTFGLYFTITPKLHLDPDAVSDVNCCCIRRCQSWNAGRIYATFMLVVKWLNAARYCVYFDRNDTLGVDLFLKLGVVTSSILNAILRSTYYLASHTGSLDQVFHQVDLCKADVVLKYSQRAKVVTILCWILILWNIIYYISTICINGQYDDVSLLFYTKTYPILKNKDIINALFIVLILESYAAWSFPQAMNCLVITFLYGHFNKLSEEFSKCISDRGEFIGNFEQFRRRHQAISRSVQEADRFLMISNVACFCCQIIGIIFVLYNTIFYRDETLAQTIEEAVFYILWLVINAFSLSLSTGLAIIINHAVSILAILSLCTKIYSL